MVDKKGRERILDVGALVPGTGESRWMFGMFVELGDRLRDQVEHLPLDVLHSAPPGSYLSPARVVLHLIGSDLRLLSVVDPGLTLPAYAEQLKKTTSEDLATMETRSVPTLALLDEHLSWRKAFVVERSSIAGYLDTAVRHPNFATRRDLLGHLIWHWSFHSGHVGAVTLELGYEYTWRSKPLAP